MTRCLASTGSLVRSDTFLQASWNNRLIQVSLCLRIFKKIIGVEYSGLLSIEDSVLVQERVIDPSQNAMVTEECFVEDVCGVKFTVER